MWSIVFCCGYDTDPLSFMITSLGSDSKVTVKDIKLMNHI